MPLIGSPTGLKLIARGPAGIGSCPGPRPSAGRRPPGSPAASPRSAPGSRSCRSRSHTRLPPPAAQRNGPAGPRLPDTTKIPGSTHPRGDSDSPALGTHPRPPCRFWAGSVSGWNPALSRHPQRSHAGWFRLGSARPTGCASSPPQTGLPGHRRPPSARPTGRGKGQAVLFLQGDDLTHQLQSPLGGLWLPSAGPHATDTGPPGSPAVVAPPP